MRAWLALALIVALPVVTRAQNADDERPSGVTLMPRYDFNMSAALLGHDDDRFTWDTHWAGDFDLVDYGTGRATFVIDYQALLGSEFRPFDPYQGNYLLEAIGTGRLPGGFEVGGILNHVSRHLGDRFKRAAVAENSLGIRVWKNVPLSDSTMLLMRGDIRKVIAAAYVDYTWMHEMDVTLRRRVHSRATVYGRGYGTAIPVDRTVAGRNMQTGGRAEAGITLQGERGALEFFGGYERMIDADPLDRIAREWAFFGFRLRGH